MDRMPAQIRFKNAEIRELFQKKRTGTGVLVDEVLRVSSNTATYQSSQTNQEEVSVRNLIGELGTVDRFATGSW